MRRIFKNVFGWITSLIIAFCIVFLFKSFVGMITTVKGTSMCPAYYSQDRLFISTWSATFGQTPERGDVITFEAPSEDLITNVGTNNVKAIYYTEKMNAGEKILYYGLGIAKKSYIKRVVGLPGDHIEIKYGKVYLNGNIYTESYLSSSVTTDMSLGGECSDLVVPDGYVFVMGDNREASSDSRRFGCIPIKKITGKSVFRWCPINRFGLV